MVKFVVTENLSFQFIESEAFLELLQLCNPSSSKTIIKADTLISDTMKLFYESREKISKYFETIDSKINLTLDIWTSPNGKSILGITGHWNDNNYVLRELLLDAVELIGPHTGINIAQHLLKTLQAYKIESKIFCITTDNASNNKTMAEELHKFLKDFDPASSGLRWSCFQLGSERRTKDDSVRIPRAYCF